MVVAVSGRAVYDACAERDGRWWVVTVPQVPGAVTQTRRLNEVDGWVREAISMVLAVPEDSFDVTVVPVLPDGLSDSVRDALQANETAIRHRDAAAALTRSVVERLGEVGGLSGGEIAQVLGVSPQRVHQLRH